LSLLFCETCHSLNADDAATCTACGAPIIRDLDAAEHPLVADRYRVLDMLGRGGMGAVYKVHDEALDEIVALKVLRADIAGTPELAARFVSEIKLARRVTHRNVCRIHEYGIEGSLRYISMEFVDGADVRKVLGRRGFFDPEHAVPIVIQIAEGLEAIHGASVIHRDLKTSNIMLDMTGNVKLLDFGIARDWNASGGITANSVVGTPEYMSPEQVLGEPLDHRSDIYAFGIVMHEVFAGDVPLRGTTPAATLLKHIQEPSALDDPTAPVFRNVPAPFVEVGRRCLQRRAADRYASMKEVLRALRTAEKAYAASSPRPRGERQTLTLAPGALEPIPSTGWRLSLWRRGRSRSLLTGAAVLAALGALAVAVALGRWSRPARMEPVASPEPTVAISPSPEQTVAPPRPAPRLPLVAAIHEPPLTRPRQSPLPARLAPVETAPPVGTSANTGVLAEALSSTDAAQRGRAFEQTVALGPSGIPLLVAALRSGPDATRAEAALAIGTLTSAGSAAVAPLAAALRDPDGYVRSSAARALGRLGDVARDAGPWLIDALRDPDERVRAEAADALPRVGTTRDAVSALTALLEDRSPRVRAVAAYALAQTHGEASPELLKALRRAAKDKDVAVRSAAQAALVALSPTRN
jgi:serine/threonine protein kinase